MTNSVSIQDALFSLLLLESVIQILMIIKSEPKSQTHNQMHQ